MYITVTTGQVAPDQARTVKEFLAGFLPRLERQTTALAAYYFHRPDKGDGVTVIVWPSADAVREYIPAQLGAGEIGASPACARLARSEPGLQAALGAL